MAVVLNVTGVEKVKFTMVNNMKQFLRPRGEVHYIGGTDILPPPLEPEEEAYILSQLDTRRSEEAIFAWWCILRKSLKIRVLGWKI